MPVGSSKQAIRRPSAGPPQALTRLLNLAEFRVTGVAYDDRLERLIVLCQHVWDVAVCPDCQQLSTHVHQYHRRVVHDLAWVGHSCYLEFSARCFTCEHCRRPFAESLKAIRPHDRCRPQTGRSSTRHSTARTAARTGRASNGSIFLDSWRMPPQRTSRTSRRATIETMNITP